MRNLTSEQVRDFVSKPAFNEATIGGKDASWPKISIVTPSYNQGRFLERTILSVLNQNYPNLEYIIMDGGSTDGSVEIIRKYERHLAFWTSERDKGQGDAIRRGLCRATGVILAYLNSDDVYLPEVLPSIGVIYRKTPGAGVIYGNLYQIDEEDRIIGDERLTCYIPLLSTLGMLHGGFGIYQPSSFWSAEAYNRVGRIDPNLVHCLDNELFLRFSLSRIKFTFIRAPLAAIRRHADAKTATLRHVAERETRLIRDKYGGRRIAMVTPALIGLTKTVRAFLYLVQGDAAYLCRKKLARNAALR